MGALDVEKLRLLIFCPAEAQMRRFLEQISGLQNEWVTSCMGP